jgi:hypothetical protein
MLQFIYILLCLFGFILPYSQFIPFIVENGLDGELFVQQLFVNKISSFFAVDLIISSVVFWIFVFSEGWRLKMQYLWIYIVCNLLVGVSFALPLFLLMRERQLKETVNLASSI